MVISVPDAALPAIAPVALCAITGPTPAIDNRHAPTIIANAERLIFLIALSSRSRLQGHRAGFVVDALAVGGLPCVKDRPFMDDGMA